MLDHGEKDNLEKTSTGNEVREAVCNMERGSRVSQADEWGRIKEKRRMEVDRSSDQERMR